jgi:hypothetical protein
LRERRIFFLSSDFENAQKVGLGDALPKSAFFDTQTAGHFFGRLKTGLNLQAKVRIEIRSADRRRGKRRGQRSMFDPAWITVPQRQLQTEESIFVILLLPGTHLVPTTVELLS